MNPHSAGPSVWGLEWLALGATSHAQPLREKSKDQHDQGGPSITNLSIRGSLVKASAGFLGAICLYAAVVQLSVAMTWEPAYVAMGAALVAGAFLTIRLRGGQPGTSLLIVPLVVAQARFGAPTLPLLALASLFSALVRGAPFAHALRWMAQDILAFALAQIAAVTLAPPSDALSGSIVFTVVFTLLRSGLYRLSERVGVAGPAHRQAEQPDAVLSLLVAPLGAIPIAVWGLVGDGAMLLAVAALLTLLTVVREAVNLATARTEAEAERDQWEKAYATLGELTQLITHEVRNPLTTILTYSDLASEALRAGAPASDRVEGHLERIRRGGRSIARLVDNLLQISRLEATEELPPAEPVDPGALTRTVVAEISPLAEQKGQTLLLEVASELPCVRASPTLLQEALTNLVSNAVKYTPNGGRVTVWARPGPDGGIALGVTDTGVGLGQADQDRLFTKFFRSSDPRVRRESGAGLGLALSYSIVERMGGHLGVESALNQGSTFRIEMPAVSCSSAVGS